MQFDISFAGKRVLLVEDDGVVAGSLAAKLRFLGIHEVLYAETLGEAREIAEDALADIALLDVRLAGGAFTIEFGHSLSARGLPVIFFSGFACEQVARATRGQVFMEKPVSLPRLKAALHRAVLKADVPAPVPALKKMAGQSARQ